MSRLSPEAEQLVRAGRAVLQPSDADRERVFQSLLQQPGREPNADASAPEPSRAAPASKAALAKLGGALTGLALAGAGVFFALRPERGVTSQTSTPATAPALVQPAEAPEAAAPVPSPPAAERTVVAPELGSELAFELGTSETSDASRAAPPRRPPRRAKDHLAREVALLSRASSALHEGRPAAALAALDEHARLFPKGALAQERAAGRARALCALGREREAQLEIAKLSPGSPHAARAARACASAKGGAR